MSRDGLTTVRRDRSRRLLRRQCPVEGSQQRRTRIQLSDSRDARARLARATGLHLKPGRNEPEAPVRVVARDCLVDGGEREADVSGLLLDERQLQIWGGRPGLESPRGSRGGERARDVGVADGGLALADL